MTDDQSVSSIPAPAAVDVSSELRTLAKGSYISMSGRVVTGAAAIVIIPVVVRIGVPALPDSNG